MEASPDVLVIGGGIIGLTAALELARAGLKVELCDRGDIGREASWAGAGIIPPGNFAQAASSYDQLRAYSSSRFPSFADQLLHETGIDCGYRQCGGIEFLGDDDGNILKLWDAEGITYSTITREKQPRGSIHGTVTQTTPYFLPDMAQVRNPRLLKALIAACEKAGVRLLRGYEAVGYELYKERITDVVFANAELPDDDIKLHASHYLITAGAWSQPLLEMLRCRVKIHPVRGQIVLYRSDSMPRSPILLHKKRYVVFRGDGYALAGSTEEPEAGFDKDTTEEGISELREFAESIEVSFKHATVERAWAGLRPGSRDGLPYIGFVPGYDNVLAAVGHFRSGIQLSLGTATMISDLIFMRTPTVDPTPFRLDRPLHAPVQLAFRS